MNFLQYIREVNGQFNISVFSTLGVLGWAACAVLYFLLYNELDGSVQNFVLSLAVLHLVRWYLCLSMPLRNPEEMFICRPSLSETEVLSRLARLLFSVTRFQINPILSTLSISSLAMACYSMHWCWLCFSCFSTKLITKFLSCMAGPKAL